MSNQEFPPSPTIEPPQEKKRQEPPVETKTSQAITQLQSLVSKENPTTPSLPTQPVQRVLEPTVVAPLVTRVPSVVAPAAVPSRQAPQVVVSSVAVPIDKIDFARESKSTLFKSPEKERQSTEQEVAPVNPSVHVARSEELDETESKRASRIVDAPSIGPKTAVRFEQVGIETVGQFLDANIQELVEKLNTKWITEALLCDWQDQARLVCEVPALCGYKAQLLVAVDCRSSAELAASDHHEVFQKINQFCNTKESVRILRSSPSSSLGRSICVGSIGRWQSTKKSFLNVMASIRFWRNGLLPVERLLIAAFSDLWQPFGCASFKRYLDYIWQF